MHTHAVNVIALVLATGLLVQWCAWRFRVPAIVLLTAAGFILGPATGLVVPARDFGTFLEPFVQLAVAIILFEGGLHMNLKKLRALAKPIRRLVTIGALVTAAGGAIAAKIFMPWDWRLSILFGTLVIVTGPTVITPLLRRLRIKHGIGLVLEAEGIFIDAVGATIAVVALEVVLAPKIGTFVEGVAGRLLIGTGMGLAGGAALALVLRWRNVIPEGLENIFGMAAAVALFEGSNAFAAESGIIAVIVMGVVVGNTRTPVDRDLREFKDQLTILLVGLLFILLAADVRVGEVRALGWRALWVLGALVFLVRPTRRAEAAGGDGVDTEGAQAVGEVVDQRRGQLGARGVDEARPAALTEKLWIRRSP